MPRTPSRWLPLALLAAAALWVRCGDLGARPMHADEANQAVKAGELLESGRYAFDPGDHHGPLLYYAALPVAWLRGQHTLEGLDEVTVRLVPALAGAAAVLLLGALAGPLGAWPAFMAAAFLAVSPPAVYYSRYFIQETLLATLTLALLVSARAWWASGRLRWALLGGACAGLMQATKASAPLLWALSLLALLAAGPIPRLAGPRGPRGGLLLAAAAGLGAASLFYSSFGAHPSGLLDAMGTYRFAASRLGSGDTGHEKPWVYFLRLLTWQRSGGLVFEQAGFCVLALAGAGVAVACGDRLLRWSACYAALLLAVLSAVPYKTPWHVVHLVPPLALLAAGALGRLSRAPLGRVLSASAALLVLGLLAFQMRRATRSYASDARNPYAYVHSSPDVLDFRARASDALARDPRGVVRVISEEYWPLPWYLRGLGRVGYWTAPPADCDGALVIASAGLAEAVQARLHGSYRRSYLGLRPGFACVIFTPEP